LFKKLFFIIFTIFSYPVYSQDIKSCISYENEINFRTDENTFVFMALLNIVNDKNEYNLNINDYQKSYYKSIYENYKRNIKDTKDIYIHNKLDEKNFKDSIFIFDSRIYSSKDEGFQIKLENNVNSYEFRRISYLPYPDIIREFYSNTNVSTLWKNEFEKQNFLTIEKYKDKVLEIINDISCFLRIKAQYPIDIIFQKSNYFNLLGQSYFSIFENKYIIKIFVSDFLKEEEILKTIRHEYVHLVLNEEVKKNSYIIENEINKFYKNVPEAKYFYLEELIAKSIEDIHYFKSKDFIIDMIFYYNKNPIYRHFIDKIPEYLSSNKNFKEFIPDLFISFSSDKEIKRYTDIRKKLFRKS
jgi:hypothetical protein